MLKVDLNCDLGESFGAYTIGMDEQVIPMISSANVACGFHAGDPVVMKKTVELCKANGTAVGAHPGYQDLQGFGRRNMAVSPAEVKAMVMYQVGALMAFTKANGLTLQHVKPHGAMYNMAAKDPKLAFAIAEGIYEVDPDLIFMGLSGSCMIEAAEKTGLRAASEVFADRAYEEDGTLVARSKPGAMITDTKEALSRVLQMVKKGSVKSISGKEIEIKADSICVHGDGAKALEFTGKIREMLTGEGVQILNLKA